jgi:AcrR family transcriptional regulator
MIPPDTPAAAFETKRIALTGQLVALALAGGFSRFGLRDLGAALGTSDRMLLYYFRTKSELVLSVLAEVSARLATALAQPGADGPLAPGPFAARALAQLSDPRIAPLVRVWTEAVARGARGEEPYRQAADAAIGQWLAWIGARLAMPDGPRKAALAAALLAYFEGAVLLEMARPGATAGAAELVGDLLAAAG